MYEWILELNHSRCWRNYWMAAPTFVLVRSLNISHIISTRTNRYITECVGYWDYSYMVEWHRIGHATCEADWPIGAHTAPKIIRYTKWSLKMARYGFLSLDTHFVFCFGNTEIHFIEFTCSEWNCKNPNSGWNPHNPIWNIEYFMKCIFACTTIKVSRLILSNTRNLLGL